MFRTELDGLKIFDDKELLVSRIFFDNKLGLGKNYNTISDGLKWRMRSPLLCIPSKQIRVLKLLLERLNKVNYIFAN